MGRSPFSCESKKKKAVVEAEEEEEEEEEEETMVKRGAWTSEEDEKLISFIQKNHGHGTWKTLPRLAGLQRCGKSCRLRWTNYLRPDIRRCGFSLAEERTIIHLHSLLGNRWSGIASHLSGRTDNDVKNHWNTHLKKRLLRAGIDPETHQPMSSTRARPSSACQTMQDHIVVASRNQLDPSAISHMLQWELVRLEAESKLASTANSTTGDGPYPYHHHHHHHHQSSTGLHHQAPPHEPIFHHSSTHISSPNPNSNTVTIQMLQNLSTHNSSHNPDSGISHEQSPTGLCPSIIDPSIEGSNPDNIINHNQFDLHNLCGTRLLTNDQMQSIIPAPNRHSYETDSLEMNSCSGSTSTNYNNTSTVTTPDYQCITSMRSEECINQPLPILDNNPAASDLVSSLIPSLVSCEDNIKDYWATLLRLLSHAPSKP